MKKVLFAVLVAVAPAVAADTPEDAAQKEYARFEGAWKIVSVEIEGKKLPETFFKGSRLVLKGPEFTYQEGGMTSKGTYRVDVSKKPKQIDITFSEGPQKDKTLLGIYELDDDTYRLCLDPTGKGRPTEFASKHGSGHVLEVLQREKEAPKEKANDREKK